MTSTCANGMFVVTQQWAAMLPGHCRSGARSSVCMCCEALAGKGISITSPRSSLSFFSSTIPLYLTTNTPHNKPQTTNQNGRRRLQTYPFAPFPLMLNHLWELIFFIENEGKTKSGEPDGRVSKEHVGSTILIFALDCC